MVCFLCFEFPPLCFSLNFQVPREGCGCFWGLCGSSGGELREDSAGKGFLDSRVSNQRRNDRLYLHGLEPWSAPPQNYGPEPLLCSFL